MKNRLIASAIKNNELKITVINIINMKLEKERKKKEVNDDSTDDEK